MAIQIAQTKAGTSTLASTLITWNNNTVTGNTIVVAVATNLSTDVSGISDTQGNTYVNALIANGTGIEVELWYAKNIIGGAGTVTIAYTSAPTASAVIQEYSGIDTVTVLDKTSTNVGNSNSLDSLSTTRTNQNLELLIGVGAAVSATFTAGGSFVNLTQQANATIDIAIEDLFVNSTGIYNATFGASGSIQWACGIASFRAAPQGTTTSTSSTSSTSTSISSTSSSTSSTSTSASTTSVSTSSTSSSLSTSSTSSSTSSTSSSISSTSTSSTSTSTSISSTSSSISSTSTSSTSTSSTSSSTSISSTSSSFSSTSSSISSTSFSTSSTSTSSTSSSSSTSSTTVPNLDYTYEDKLSLTTYGFPALPTILDNFNRADAEPISGNWANMDVGEVAIRIVGNQAASGTVNVPSDNAKSYFTFTTYGPDVDVYTTITAVPANGKSTAIWARIVNPNTTSLGGYIFNYNAVAGVDTYILAKTINNVYQGDAVTTTGPELGPGDKIGLRCQGSTISGYLNKDGIWTRVATWTDTSFTGAGYIGLEIKDINGTGRVDDFSGGNINSSDLINSFTNAMYSDVGGDDGDYFIEYGSEFMIREYKKRWTNNTDNIFFTWRGRSTLSSLISPILIQIYNISTDAWETLASATTVPADTDFSVTVSQTTNLSNYYDANKIVTFRSYQQVI